MTKQTKQLLIRELSKLTNQRGMEAAIKRNPERFEFGICYLITLLTKDRVYGTLELRNYSLNWPHFSGDRDYPIPGGMEQLSLPNFAQWKGEQGMYRRSLIRHLIKELKKEL